MPDLIRYVITRLSIGFLIGSACALCLMAGRLLDYPFSDSHLGLWLVVWGMGSTFALGYLATALAFEG